MALLTEYVLSDTLLITQTTTTEFIDKPTSFSVDSAITVSHETIPDRMKSYGVSASVTQEIAFTLELGKTIEDDTNLQHFLSGYLLKASTKTAHEQSNYLSPEGEAAKAALSKRTTVTFTYGSDVITLRPPIWGNKDKYQVVRIQRETKGKDLQIYQEGRWPTSETLTLDFQYLTQDDADAFMEFINSYNGKQITYVDHFSASWSGFITNPDAEFRHVGRNNISVSIEFQGVKTS